MSRKTVILTVALGFVAAIALAAPAADKLVSPLPGGFPAFVSDNYAGYLDLLDGRQAYYWFIASENSPSTDPVMFWFNGGPGCSSLLGLFTEIGPFRQLDGGKWVRDPHAWTTNLNVVFMDSPGGVGFSPDLPGQGTLWNDTYVAQLNYAGVRSWLAKFPEYKGRDLYIAGESYAGHYVPQLVYQIVTGPDATVKSMLQGFMAGNPCTGSYDGTNTDLCFVANDPTLTLYEQTHGLESLDPSIVNQPFSSSDSSESSTPYDPYDYLVPTCGATPQTRAMRERQQRAHHHHHSRLEFGVPGNTKYDPCVYGDVTTWLNRADVVTAIHAKPGIVWNQCNNTILYPTPNNITTGVLPLYRYFINSTALKILVYSGTADTVVNFIQTQKILFSLNRPLMSPFTPWYYQDTYEPSWRQMGGYYLQWDRLAWASVRGAGHEVPMYQPARAKALLNSFIATGAPGMAPQLWTSTTDEGSITGTDVGVSFLLLVVGLGLGFALVKAVHAFGRKRQSADSDLVDIRDAR